MQVMDIKICGLSEPRAVEAALGAGASHIGFIFFAKSPRNVDAPTAGRLAQLARGKAKTVAVTVNADDRMLDEIVRVMEPDILQLHGSEPPERVAAVKQLFSLPVMKAFSIKEAGDLAGLGAYEGVADRFLLDAKPPAGAKLPGGNGVVFDWSLLDALDEHVDYMLSGGINISNVGDAIANTRASGIDVSSGVETAPGVKNVDMIGKLIGRIRSLAGQTTESPNDKQSLRV